MNTVAVIGASYGGNRAAQLLSKELPEGWRIVLVDRNSHMNHLYVFPRFAILPEHGHKAFIPYTNLLVKSCPEDMQRHAFLHAYVTSIDMHSLTLSCAFPEHGVNENDRTLHFDYLVYALGSHLPAPINVWGSVDTEAEKENTIVHDGTKAKGISWLKRFRGMVERTNSVLVVGGGALGIQYATDTAEVWPNKRVTLLHSRKQLLPRFDEAMHEEIITTLSELNIKVILGERLDLSAPPKIVVNESGMEERIARTRSGRALHTGVVASGISSTRLQPGPNIRLHSSSAPVKRPTDLLREALPDAIVPDGPSKDMVRVSRTMQVAVCRQTREAQEDASVEGLQDVLARVSIAESFAPTSLAVPEEVEVPYPHLFAVGDVADAFGAIKAGHTAHYQAEVAARNILTLIQQEMSPSHPAPKLEHYAPGAPAIKLSLGLSQAVYQVQGVVGRKTDVSADRDALSMWNYYGINPTEETMCL
ncbi:uncharacterized protein PHACADRAFT_187619 [Phanerochaete carnosa HHB-10118-sp]|uniref:FAD/NAD(P)-binding domain-containing protein n=1 Tax=Phanerochaete carnosa (strain HHB-10118-sp) TaxID=650164 RepID=K5VW14_PHACS|nr:uncharacterized protein PHACADRAFT_187619 [Phanerochaete carnosa HHB-10118-sp]EKM51005.1 hypothetical protein PHACADRAFT_187619 [Phanerochaete carnosa HHB-10118-sp]